MFNLLILWIQIVFSAVAGALTGQFDRYTEKQQIAFVQEYVEQLSIMAEDAIDSTPKPEASSLASVKILDSWLKNHVSLGQLSRKLKPDMVIHYLDNENVICEINFKNAAIDTFSSGFYYSNNGSPWEPVGFEPDEEGNVLIYDEAMGYWYAERNVHTVRRYETFLIDDGHWYYYRRLT